MDDNLDYNINESEEPVLLQKEKLKRKKVTIILSLIIVILAIIIIVSIVLYFTVLKKDDNNNKEKEVIKKYSIYYNISTTENDVIRNSFTIGRENFIPEIGNLNDGNNYEKNERDNFDLCIPDNAEKDKTKYKTILLHVHGGGWGAGNKADVSKLCEQYSSYGFMTAAMSYTLLNSGYTQFNIFRILDEITAVLKTLKNFLKEKEYDENKLELIITGGSAGAHLSLLYSYMIKNPPIPIKFILDNVGPVTLDPEYFYNVKPGLEPLLNIEPVDIDEALKENKLIHMNGSATGVNLNNFYLMAFMNAWLGFKYEDSFDEIFSDRERQIINNESEIYKERMNKIRYAFPITYVTNESIPTLCIYGGKDKENGVAQYAQLKKAFLDNNNKKNITLCYFRYGEHEDVFENGSKTELNNYDKEFDYYIKNYLNSFKNNN